MRIAFLPAHPSQLWLMNAVAQELGDRAEVVWVLRDKDVTVALAEALGLAWHRFSSAQSGLVGNATEFLGAIFQALRLNRRLRIDAWFTKYGPGNIAARLTGRPNVSFNDDDADVVPVIAWTSYPFANSILATSVTRMGRFESKTVRYQGYHELCYLHPNRFSSDPQQIRDLGLSGRQRYAVVRLSAMSAHHDVGVRGCDDETLIRFIDVLLEEDIRPVISAERALPADYQKYSLRLPVHVIHHVLAHASIYLGDSQTMAAEAAVLGTPTIQYSAFAGQLSYLQDLETFGLVKSFTLDKRDEAVAYLRRISADASCRSRWQERREQMLQSKIDPAPFFADQLAALRK